MIKQHRLFLGLRLQRVCVCVGRRLLLHCGDPKDAACQVDFVATLEGAPDIQLPVHGKEVRMRWARTQTG